MTRFRPSGQSAIAGIGGGLIGLAVAWRLAQRGWDVTLFEKSTLANEASWAGAGMLSPGGEITGPSELATLAIESRALYGSFINELDTASGLTVDYQECGALDLAYSDEEWSRLEARVQVQSSLAITHRKLQPIQISTFWPRVRKESLAGGIFYPGDGTVNPREMTAALNIACGRSGVILKERCAVVNVGISESGALVQTQQDRYLFAAAVIAAGAWSSSMPVTGVPPIPQVEPIKGHLIGYHQPEQTCNTIVRHGPMYFLQRANGLMIAGASVERAGFDREIKPGVVADLVAKAGFVFPHLAETTPSQTWTGLRPGSDRLQLGPWHSPYLYLAYGHYRNGILLAPVTAERIADAITANLQMPRSVSDERR